MNYLQSFVLVSVVIVAVGIALGLGAAWALKMFPHQWPERPSSKEKRP